MEQEAAPVGDGGGDGLKEGANAIETAGEIELELLGGVAIEGGEVKAVLTAEDIEQAAALNAGAGDQIVDGILWLQPWSYSSKKRFTVFGRASSGAFRNSTNGVMASRRKRISGNSFGVVARLPSSEAVNKYCFILMRSIAG